MEYKNIKQYAESIVNESIEITSYESGNQTLFKYKHNSILQAIIKKNMYSYLHEYDDITILRDEAYATYYESIIKLIEKEQYTEEEMDVIAADINTELFEETKRFIRLLNGYVNNNLKYRLTDSTRRDRRGGSDHYITDRMHYDSESIETVEDKEYEVDESSVENIWFYNALTPTEKEFIEQSLEDALPKYQDKKEHNKEVQREKKIKQRIKKKVNEMEEKENDYTLERSDVINEILDIEDNNLFVITIKRYQKRTWFNDLILDRVSTEARIAFNTNNITNKVLFEYRRALFTALD